MGTHLLICECPPSPLLALAFQHAVSFVYYLLRAGFLLGLFCDPEYEAVHSSETSANLDYTVQNTVLLEKNHVSLTYTMCAEELPRESPQDVNTKHQYGGHQCPVLKSSSIQVNVIYCNKSELSRGSTVLLLMLAFLPPSSGLIILVTDKCQFLENGSKCQ
jgi:hypothetical protein